MKIMVFLADGFEEVEALTVVDYLRRMDIEVDMISISDDYKVKGAHGIEVIADVKIEEIENSKAYRGLVIPGGMPGATNLRDDKRVIEIVKEMDKEKKMIGAICAGPIVLERAGIIEGKRITSYPGFESELKGANYSKEIVAVDGHIITSRGPYLAGDFALELVSFLLGEEKAKSLKEDILYNLKN